MSQGLLLVCCNGGFPSVDLEHDLRAGPPGPMDQSQIPDLTDWEATDQNLASYMASLTTEDSNSTNLLDEQNIFYPKTEQENCDLSLLDGLIFCKNYIFKSIIVNLNINFWKAI